MWSWETRVSNYSPILATAGGLVFNGSMDRYLRALDADKGTLLWQTRLASQVVGAPITFAVAGRQYIAIIAGGGPIKIRYGTGAANGPRSSAAVRSPACGGRSASL